MLPLGGLQHALHAFRMHLTYLLLFHMQFTQLLLMSLLPAALPHDAAAGWAAAHAAAGAGGSATTRRLRSSLHQGEQQAAASGRTVVWVQHRVARTCCGCQQYMLLP